MNEKRRENEWAMSEQTTLNTLWEWIKHENNIYLYSHHLIINVNSASFEAPLW